ncbi:UNVERIFIED_CONTAM: hypothetical protein K2H54_023879 [Gekko kuhli]
MSRRSLRLSAAACRATEDGHGDCNLGSRGSSYAGKKTFEEQFSSDGCKWGLQTALVHFLEGSQFCAECLDDDGDLKGGHTTVIQANGDVATSESQTALSNGYTGNDCGILSERKEVLTAFSTVHMPPTRIYSRDRSQKHKSGGLTFYTSKILEAARCSATSVTSLLVQLFHVVLLKLGYDSKAYSNYYGNTNVKEILREDHQLGTNGEYFCDDCKGKKQLEVHAAAYLPSSQSKGVARTIGHIFSLLFAAHLAENGDGGLARLQEGSVPPVVGCCVSREGRLQCVLVAWDRMVPARDPDLFDECIYSDQMPSSIVQDILVPPSSVGDASRSAVPLI